MQHATQAELPWRDSDLSILEDELRCPVCRCFFSTPMRLPNCEHTFCSLCIRRSLSIKPECPSCRVSCDVRQLRNNQLVERVVERWLACRSKVHQQLHAPPPPPPVAAPAAAVPSAPAPRDSGLLKHFANAPATAPAPIAPRRQPVCAPRQRDYPDPDALASVGMFVRVRRPRPMERPTAAATFESESSDFEDAQPRKQRRTVAPEIVVDLISDQEDDFVEPPASVPLQMPPSSASAATAAANEVADGRQPCPVCGLRILASFINTHVNSCLASHSGRNSFFQQTTTTTTPKPTTEVRQPLTMPGVAVMKDADLRSFLNKFGVDARGSRETLLYRVKELVLLWNASCDARQPPSLSEIARQASRVDVPRRVSTPAATLFTSTSTATASVSVPPAAAPSPYYVPISTSERSAFAALIAQLDQRRQQSGLPAHVRQRGVAMAAWLAKSQKL